MSPQEGERNKGSGNQADTKGKVKLSAEDDLRESKGKGKMVEPVDAEDEEEDEEDFDEDAGSSSADDEGDEEEDEGEEDEDDDQEEQPPSKKAKVDGSSAKSSGASKAGPSSSSKAQPAKKRKKSSDDEDEDDALPEIVNHASGDEVDTSLIIPGGRRARKGRPQTAQQAQYKYQQKLADSDEDSW